MKTACNIVLRNPRHLIIVLPTAYFHPPVSATQLIIQQYWFVRPWHQSDERTDENEKYTLQQSRQLSFTNCFNIITATVVVQVWNRSMPPDVARGFLRGFWLQRRFCPTITPCQGACPHCFMHAVSRICWTLWWASLIHSMEGHCHLFFLHLFSCFCICWFNWLKSAHKWMSQNHENIMSHLKSQEYSNLSLIW